MHLDPATILARINTKGKGVAGSAAAASGDSATAQAAPSGGSSLFSSVFSSARSQLAKSMGMQ